MWASAFSRMHVIGILCASELRSQGVEKPMSEEFVKIWSSEDEKLRVVSWRLS
jgi:hypothetical protein